MAEENVYHDQQQNAGRKTLFVAALIGLAILVLAIFWPGYDAQDTPSEEGSVWVLQTGSASRFARLNTALEEIETVKPAVNATAVAQTGSEALIFTNGYRDMSIINPAAPQDLSDAANAGSLETPAQTRSVRFAAKHLLYISESGALSAALVDDPLSTTNIDPNANVEVDEGEERPVFHTQAATINPDGIVAAVESVGSGKVRVIIGRADDGRVTQDTEVELSLGDDPQIGYINGKWVILNTTQGELWVEGSSTPVEIPLEANAALQQYGSGSIYIADSGGLWEVAGPGQEPIRVLTKESGARPAVPMEIDDTTYAAWLEQGSSGGTLWSSKEGESHLSYDGVELTSESDPRFVTNGATSVLNDVKSGWVWLLPQGVLVPSSQGWDTDEDVVEEVISVETQEVTDPRPPVAEPDAFGVRAGSSTVLQVLLNDHDPNRDVLSIDPESIEGLDPEFGTVSVINNQQLLTVEVNEDAKGSASFTYRATDGTTADGLLSEPATVTLTVVADEKNEAPQWCGVEDCLAQWPSPTLAPGGSATVQVLPGWVDPDGDPIFLQGAANPSGEGTAIANPDGSLTYHYPASAGQESVTVPLELTIADTKGAATTKVMNFRVSGSPELEMDPIVAVGVVGKPLVVPLRPHVSGADGQLQLREVVSIDAAALQVQPSKSSLRFTAEGKEPGSHVVQVTVGDSVSEVTQTVRVVLEDPETAQVTTKPVTIFVRPGEDVTVDTLPTVANPAGHVLLVSDLVAVPEGEAELTVDIVGEQYVHASGTTEDGSPGLLGTATYRVSDGSGSPNATTTGQATFYLLPEAERGAPIATDQWVTVPAGAQVDVPVLEAAHAPAGSSLAIDPGSIENNQDAGLAFATPTHVRYLAPSEPGEYSVDYSIYRLGDPSLQDTAQLTFRVIPQEEESRPRPVPLEGRTLAGGSVSIPLNLSVAQAGGGLMELDSIVEQPEQGSAAISSEGDAVIYTARPDAAGQDTFVYQVRDQDGDTATSTVTVAISDNVASPAPITFSDYVQMTVGDRNTVSVYPTSNDVDPTGGVLTVVDVEPNAPVDSPEFATLAKRIIAVDDESGEVQLSAGAELGTSSFIYTVRNEKGDTATGLIVTKVIRDEVPSSLILEDTRLDAETLQALPDGVDVVSNKVVWNAGAPAGLNVEIWGDDHPDYAAAGQSIAGPVPDTPTVLPFSVSGTTYGGEEAKTYAFLRIPTVKDVRLALRAGFTQIEVDEDGTESVSLSDAIAVPKGEKLVVDTAGVHASGARAGASCTVEGLTLRYVAGAGAPWTDSCVIPAKLEGQEGYTYLSMMVKIIPHAPQPTLLNASITVSPGTQDTYDLNQMVQWDGPPQWEALEFQVSGESELFTTSRSGSLLTVGAVDTATPTRVAPVIVSLPSHPDATPATLNLVVGPAPQLLPKGATVREQCTQASGAGTCHVQVIGAAGEVNPFPRTPLKVVSVAGGQGCTGISFAVGTAGTIGATWGPDTPGTGTCQATFVVEDAQGRQSSGDRNGTVLLDLKGLPSPPETVVWTAYTSSSVTLKVPPAAASYPPVTGYVWSSGSDKGVCSPDGECYIKGLTPGAKRTYEIQTKNDVGLSRTGTSIEAWAYEAPSEPSGQWKPIPTEGGAGKRVQIEVRADSSTKQLMVTGLDKNVTVGADGKATFDMAVPSNTETHSVTITPISAHDPPPIADGSEKGRALTLTGLHGVGKPTVSIEVRALGRGEVSATASLEQANGASSSDVKLSLRKKDGEWKEGSSRTFNAKPGQKITVEARGETVIDGVSFGSSEVVSSSVEIEVPTPSSGGTYWVASQRSSSDRPLVYRWDQIETRLPSPDDDLEQRFSTSASSSSPTKTIQSLIPEPGQRLPTLYLHNCTADGKCSTGVPLEPESGSPAPLQINFKQPERRTCPADARDMADIRYYQTLYPEYLTDSSSTVVWRLPLPNGLKDGQSQWVEWLCLRPQPEPDPDPDPDPGWDDDD